MILRVFVVLLIIETQLLCAKGTAKSQNRPKVQKTPPPTPSPQPVGAKGPSPSPVVRIECSRSEQCPRGFKCVQKRLCVPEEELCEPGWHYNKDNDFCYFVGVGSFNYSQAVEYCASDCSSEVVWFDQSSFPKFQTEWLWVNKLATNNGVQTYWIGAKKNSTAGKRDEGWMWTNGEPLKYFNWRRGQPDGCCGGDVTCVLVNYKDTSGVWEDAGCGRIWRNPQGFVCKQPAEA